MKNPFRNICPLATLAALFFLVTWLKSKRCL